MHPKNDTMLGAPSIAITKARGCISMLRPTSTDMCSTASAGDGLGDWRPANPRLSRQFLPSPAGENRRDHLGPFLFFFRLERGGEEELAVKLPRDSLAARDIEGYIGTDNPPGPHKFALLETFLDFQKGTLISSNQTYFHKMHLI